jgi:hypothetical protein
MMKRFATALLAFGIMVAAGLPVARADTTCPPSPASGSTVNGALVVPTSQVCTLSPGVTVTGSVEVQSGATLHLTVGSVGGNVEADNCVEMAISPEANPGTFSVGGNVQIEGCSGSSGFDAGVSGLPIKIGGNFECSDNSAPCFATNGSVKGNLSVDGNSGGGSRIAAVSIGGNAQIDENTGGTTIIEGNTIAGNLQCQGNTAVSNEGFPNTVGGHKRGQCAGTNF